MNYINDIILSIILLLFPIMVYLLYIGYNKNVGKEEDKLALSLMLFSSIYLILSMDLIYYPRIALYMANIAVMIAYLRKCPAEAMILSLFYMFIIISLYSINIFILIIGYIVYIIAYYIKEKYNLNTYIFISFCYLVNLIVSFTLKNIHYNDVIYITVIITLTTTYFIIYMLSKGDSILNYHISYKELVKEKQIKTSLFKITHEIKNPLAVCKGYFSMLDIDNETQCKKYLPIIREEINHALLILNDFSDLSKIKMEKEVIDIDYVLDETINNLSELLQSENIKIAYKPKYEVYIEGDYTRLMQVFINILKNSIEALENVKNKKINVKLISNEKDVQIVFKDNGCGMDEDTLLNFNKPFYTTKTKGTGLGTTLSFEIVKAHNGTIVYNSIHKKGTEVIISLPKMTTKII